jgi:AraC-like DNA-binding protein
VLAHLSHSEGHDDAAPGTCNLIAPGELHTGRSACRSGWIYRNLYVETHLMTRLLPEPQLARLRGCPVQTAARERSCFGLTADAHLCQPRRVQFTAAKRNFAVVGGGTFGTDHLVPGHSLRHPGRERPAVRRVKDWLDAHPEQNVSVQALAELASLSAYHLVRVFHQQVGTPPHKYQTIVRVLRARKLLTSGATIAQVAYSTGFCDQSHLTNCFKRTLGVTPGTYAASRPKC